MRIAGVGRAFPPHYYTQAELVDELRRMWTARHPSLERLESLHRHAAVGGRHLALARGEYAQLTTFGQSNDAFVRIAPEVAAAAARDAAKQAAVPLERVTAIVTTTVTGIAVPAIDARLMNLLSLPPQAKRLPLFGLGCAGGAAAIGRAADYLRGNPREIALVVAVELCSLTVQKEDLSLSNLIATGLFGDGAAAALMLGAEVPDLVAPRVSPAPRVIATRSVFYPATERLMGWDVSGSGFRIVLSAHIPRIVRERLRGDVDEFLAQEGLTRADIGAWISHPGGPRVLEAVQEALELPPAALELAWTSLREVGNLSSVSVLLVLGDTLQRPPPPGGFGVMLAMGPGFCCELVLMRW